MTVETARRCVVVAAIAVSCEAVHAQNVWQTPGGGAWGTGSNWSLGLPNGTQDVSNPLSAAPVTLNINATVRSFLSASDLTIGAGGRLNGSLADSASTVQVDAALLLQGGGTLAGLIVAPGTGGTVTFGSGSNALEATIFGANVTVASNGFASLFGSNTFNASLVLGTDSGDENLRLHDGNSRLIIGSSGVMSGFGRVSSFFTNGQTVNNGLVHANTSGKSLVLGSTFTTGGGTFRASGGGVLVLSTVLTGTGTTAIDVLPGSAVRVSGGVLTGTFASASGSGFTFDGSSSNAISNLSLTGNATFPEGSFAAAFNTNEITGNVRFESDVAAQNLRLHDGNSLVRLTGTGLISGFGRITRFFESGTLDIDGTLRADTAGKVLRVEPTFTTGSGLIEVSSGGTVSLGRVVTGDGLKVRAPINQGRVLVDGGSIRGTFAESSGTGLTFTPSTSNDFLAADITGNVTLPEGAFVANFGATTVRGTTALGEPTGAGTPATLRLHDGNSRFTVPAGGLMRGAGQVTPFFTNGVLAIDGVVRADVASAPLRLAPTFITGSGAFEAVNGATLSIGGVFDGVNATITPQPGSTVLVDGGSVRGTYASSTGTGFTFSSSASNSVATASVSGNMTVPDGGFVAFFGESSVSGKFRIDSLADGSAIRLHDGNTRLTLTSTASLQGFGRVIPFFTNGRLVIEGNATADVAGQELILTPTLTTLSGSLQARNGGTLALSSNTTAVPGSLLTVDAHPDSRILLRGGTITGTLGGNSPRGLTVASSATNNSLSSAAVAANILIPDGGLLQVFGPSSVSGTTRLAGPDAAIRLHDGNADLTNSGTLRGHGQIVPFFSSGSLLNTGSLIAEPAGTTLRLGNTFTVNTGLIEVVPSAVLLLQTNYSQTAGELRVNGLLSYTGTLTVAGGLVTGDGNLSGSLSTTAATIAPGNSAGSLELEGNLTMTSASTLAVEIAGYTPGTGYDRLAVIGQGDLAGSLSVDFVGFIPAVGDTFDVLTRASNGSSGAFTSVLSADPLIEFSVSYTAAGGLPNDRVRITVTNVIPEPATAAWLALPGVALLRRRR